MLLFITYRSDATYCNLYQEYFNHSDGTMYNSNWIIDISGVDLGGSEDDFAVYSNRWKGRDLDGDAYWKTITVNIAGMGPVTATLKIEGTGDMESSDYIKVYYILDGGSPVLFETNGEKYDAFSLTTASQDGLVGNTLQIKVKMKNSASDEKHYIDDVVMSGTCCNAEIDDVIIYNLDNGTTFDVIQDGETYTLGSLPDDWNIEALVSGSTAQSVKFTWSGDYTATNIENTYPFRSPTDNVPLNLGIGDYTLLVKVYSQDAAGGSVCDEKELHFSVIPDCDGEIDNVIIYNLGNGTTYDVIQDGDTYTLGSLPENWNIEALVSGSTAESVKFIWSGDYTATNIENTYPFRSPTDNVPLNLGVGNYTLVVKLYSEDAAGGTLCDEVELHFSITQSCLLTVDVGSDQDICDQLPGVITATVNNASDCTTSNSDCNHTLANSGGWLENPNASTICGDNTGTKLWTQSGEGVSFITLDLGVVVPAGTTICANMKLEHCSNTNTTYSNAQISSSLNATSGFVTVISSVTFSQSTFQEFCYTLANSARYIKILDNGNCAFRVDYVEYTTQTNNSSLTYQWTGPGIVGPNNQASITVNLPGTYTVVVTDCEGCTATASYTKPPALEVTAVTTNVTCYGGTNGSIDVSVSGGTPSYHYLWNDGATTQDRSGLSAGTYTVTVTDENDCTATLTKTITQPTELIVTAVVTNVTCGGSNGAIDVSVSGGTPPYDYLWNDGATSQDRTNLTAGTYTVTVSDEHNCTVEASFTVTEPDCELSITATSGNVSCHGSTDGSIDVTASGVQCDVSYLWNDGVTTEDRTGLAAGTYTVIVTDGANCTASLTVTITEPDELEISGTVLDVSITAGADGSIDVTVTGGTLPYTYLWNDGVTTEDRTGLTAGTYSVTVTDAHGCTKQKTFIVNEPPCSFAITQNHTDVSCYGGNDGSIVIGFHGEQGTVTFLWSDGATTQNRSGLTAGTYTVTATDEGGCTATRTITIEQPDELVISGTTIDVTINGGSDGSIDVTVTGGTGPYTYLWNDGATTEDRTGLAAGTYTVTVTDDHGCTASQTFIVNQPDCVCIPPSTFTIDSLSATQANLCWNEIPCAEGYLIRWRTQPRLKWLYRTVNAPVVCSIFTNQYPDVYEIQVATICGTGDTSAYSEMFIFHTYPSCLPPEGLHTTNVTTSKATLHWDVVPDAGSYTVAYRAVGTPTFKKKNTTATSLNLKGLLPNTTYEWKVLSKCGSGAYVVTGQYSGLSTFTTLSQRISLTEENYTNAAFKVYPNPASYNFNIDFDLGVESGDEYLLIISNTLGQVVYSETNKLVNGRLSEHVLAGEIFADGLYSVSILVNGHQFSQKMIISK